MKEVKVQTWPLERISTRTEVQPGDVGEDVGNVSGMLGVGRFPQTHLLGIFFLGGKSWKDENILQDRSGLEFWIWNLFVFFCLGRRLRNVKYLHDRMFDTDKCCFILGKMNEI